MGFNSSQNPFSIILCFFGRFQKNTTRAIFFFGKKKNNTYRMLFLFHIQDSSILESPLDNIGLGRGTLFILTLLQLGPEFGEILEFDQMPYGGKRSLNDSRFGNGS